MKQVTTAKGQLVLLKPGLLLKEGLEVVLEHAPHLIVEDEVIPLAAYDASIASANDVEARLVITAIEFFK